MGLTIKQVSEKYEIAPETLRYYEKAGVIPPVTRTAGGRRNYSEEDIGWVEHAKCMRAAGLPIEALAKYLKLYKEGDATFKDRLDLLVKQRDALLAQKKQLETTLEKLNYKISKYGKALETGILNWDEP